ncbi:MAG: hypothetical protein FJ087_10620 [Deltaproteobacteria bacterium]|nr:hypothetical protein [Deltaproteobacteria bacterium]
MTIEEAIRTAITFEKRVKGVYAGAATEAADETGGRFLAVLEAEEQRHVAYLESRLVEWTKTGKVNPETVETAIPSRERIARGLKSIQTRMRLTPDQRDSAIAVLKRALDVEVETSDFYKRMVAELPAGEAQAMFARFLEIEEGHVAIVAAELDNVRGLGYWFDVREFDLEGA